MTLPQNAVVMLDASATANNVNAGGFDTGHSFTLTDLAVTGASGTSATPTVSSASYTFVTADVDAHIYIVAGTDWYFAMFRITAVSAGVATLAAAVGEAWSYSTAMNKWTPSTVQGVATSASPTGGTFGVHYGSKTAAITTATDFTATGTTLTSATAAFTVAMEGNYVHLTTTGTGGFGVVGWYKIVTYTNATTVTLDRDPTTGTTSVAVTGYVGGAMSMGALDDAFFEAMVPGNNLFAKLGTYTLGGSISVGTGVGTAANVIRLIGYKTTPGDSPTLTDRPTFACGANTITQGAFWNTRNIIFTGTGTSVFTAGSANRVVNCKFLNISTTAGRIALGASSSILVFNCEAVCYRGYGISGLGHQKIVNCEVHDSDVGIRNTSSDSSAPMYVGNLIYGCVTHGIQMSGSTLTGLVLVYGNTIYGAENKLGNGLSFGTSDDNNVAIDNILYGLVTGANSADTQTLNFSDYNDYYNNTNDVSSATTWHKGMYDVAVNPSFVNVGQVTGSTATTTAGNHLVQSGATFITSGVVAGDFLYIVSGTGVTAGIYGILSVDSETQVTTDITLSANATADKVFQITTGRNFAVQGAV